MTSIVKLPYDTTPLRDKANKVVQNGYVFVGKQDLDPSIPANQIRVFYVDEAQQEIDLSQPFRTNAQGFFVNQNGTIISPRVEEAVTSYSLLISKTPDNTGQIWYLDNVSAEVLGFINAENVIYSENGNVENALRKRAGYYTLTEAQAVDLELGQLVIMTSHSNALYKVVPSTDTGGFYLDYNATHKFRLMPHDKYVTGYFGVVGDGTTDMSSEITAADVYCTSIGVTLFWESGHYRGFGLRPTASWIGIDGDKSKCLIQSNNFDVGDNAGFVRYQDQSSFVVGNITFDGDVSADPAAWDSTNYNDFTGSQALHLNNCADWVVINVKCQNSFTAAFRTEACNGGLVDRLEVQRARGNFGDGYYNVSSTNINITNSTARDYTRIGFVCESSVGGLTTSEVYYSGCKAFSGHDQSVNYGGGEFNAGFWFENSTSIFYSNCLAHDQESYGFVAAGTKAKSGESTNEGFYVNCKANDCLNIGFRASSLNEQIFVSYSNCFTRNSSVCYSLNGLGGDMAVYNGCKGISSGNLDGNTSNSAVFFVDSASSTPVKAIINDCEGLFLDTTGVANNSVNTADITTFSANPEDIIVTNYRRIDATLPKIKNRQSPDGALKLIDTDAELYIFPTGGAKLVDIRGGNVQGDIRADDINLDTTMREDLNFYDGVVKGSLDMKEFRSQHSIQAGLYTGRPVVYDVDINVERDISTSGYALRLQYEDTAGETAIIKGTMQNTAGTTTSNNFIWKVRSSSQLFANGLISDNSVTNTYLDNATPLNFSAGEQKVPLI